MLTTKGVMAKVIQHKERSEGNFGLGPPGYPTTTLVPLETMQAPSGGCRGEGGTDSQAEVWGEEMDKRRALSVKVAL